MFSQKTTELLRYIRRYRSIGYRILVVNAKRDVRYGDNCIASHDEKREEALMISSLSEIDEIVRTGEYGAVVMDEAQFFPDLYEYCTQWADECPIRIVVAGLDGTFERKPFGDILRLIPHAEEVLRLTALCAVCRDGTIAIFSQRKQTKETKETKEAKEKCVILVGGTDAYQPVCRRHYLE